MTRTVTKGGDDALASGGAGDGQRGADERATPLRATAVRNSRSCFRRQALDGALRVAEDARAAVQRLAIEHRSSEVSDHVTLSLGVATVEPSGAPIDATNLVTRADAALYAAKRNGRNRTECDATPASPEDAPAS
jgi:GGDEF domain-containing protein